MPKNKLEILKSFVDELKNNYKEKIIKIILYGSVARGEEREDSDIDVLIITNYDSFKMQKLVSDVVIKILLEYGVYISAKVLSVEEFNQIKKLNTSFYRNILKDGVVVGWSWLLIKKAELKPLKQKVNNMVIEWTIITSLKKC